MTSNPKCPIKRVSALFASEVDKPAARRNRTFVGQCDHMLEVYQLVIKKFRHDDMGLLAEQLAESTLPATAKK